MVKCGKGCIPECQYFTTGGCISPFNCPYKVGTGYINTATSVIGAYTQGSEDLNEPKIKKWFRRLVEEGKIHQEPANYDAATLQIYIDHLEKENAALRKQVSEMIMPPCTLGDTLYITSFCFGDGYDEAGNAVHKSGWQITETKVDEKNFFQMCDLLRNDKAFFSKEAAEAYLAELQGEQHG